MEKKRYIITACIVSLAFFASSVFLAAAQISTSIETDAGTTDTSISTPPEEVPEEPVAETDTTPPEIISISAISTDPTTATIAWTTDEPTTGVIEYGLTTSYDSTADPTHSIGLEHVGTLTGLLAETTYHYRIKAVDSAGNVMYSASRTFTTAPEPIIIDEDPPSTIELTLSEITETGATITIKADEEVNAYVEYGPTASYGFETPITEEFSQTHSISLSGLTSGTDYYYRVILEDFSQNISASPEEMFATLVEEVSVEEEPLTTPETESATTTVSEPITFAIANVETVSVGTSTATITWTTNQLAAGSVAYGKIASYGSTTSESAILALTHQAKLTNLAPGTNYLYQVIAKNALGNTISKSGFEFSTLFVEKKLVQTPIISNIQAVSVGTSTASIIWNTNIPAGGRLRYGLTSTYTKNDGGHTHLLTAHTHPLTNLSPGTMYHYQAMAGSEGNMTLSKDYTFTTLAIPESTPMVTPQKQEKPIPGVLINSTPPTKPILIHVEGFDGQVMFLWLRDFTEKPGIQVRIIRKLGSAPTVRTDGEVVFDGNGKTFTDTNVENGTTYHYAIFAYDIYNRFSPIVRVAVTPKADKDQMVLEGAPEVIQTVPLFTFENDILAGMNGREVRHLQAVLGQFPSLYPEKLVTGYFGPRTLQAITRLQKKYKLPQTGFADARTRAKLEELSHVSRVVNAEAHNTFSRDLTVGKTGDDITLLQEFLDAAGHYPEGLITGYFGSLTREALIRFQTTHRIVPAAGYFGPVTRARVNLFKKSSSINK